MYHTSHQGEEQKGYSKVLCDWHVSLLSLDTRDATTEDLGLILEVLTARPKNKDR